MDDDFISETTNELDRLKIHNQSDVQRMWELLMEPLGFRATSVWVTFIGTDDRPTRFLVEIAESDQLPAPQEVANLFGVLEQVCAEEGEGTSVAFLVTRPGRDTVNAFDRDLAGRLISGARSSSVGCTIAPWPSTLMSCWISPHHSLSRASGSTSGDRPSSPSEAVASATSRGRVASCS